MVKSIWHWPAQYNVISTIHLSVPKLLTLAWTFKLFWILISDALQDRFNSFYTNFSYLQLLFINVSGEDQAVHGGGSRWVRRPLLLSSPGRSPPAPEKETGAQVPETGAARSFILSCHLFCALLATWFFASIYFCLFKLSVSSDTDGGAAERLIWRRDDAQV